MNPRRCWLTCWPATLATISLLAAARLAEAVIARGKWLDTSSDPEAVALRALRAAIAKAVTP